MSILGIDIPDELISATMRRTDWTVEPIHSTDDINTKWIGTRPTQVGATMIRLLWDTESELELMRRQAYARNEIESLISDWRNGNLWDKPSVISQHILGHLRMLFLVNCLLANGHQ